MDELLPGWINAIAFYCSWISTLIILLSIVLHLRNYRKPFEQRLMIRIQLIVPLFALSCYSMLTNQTSLFNKTLLEPTREVYEAFVIYTFFSLLTDMLGGERNIIIMTSGREPVHHPGLIKYILPPLDISDSYTFLAIKRGILQYVWLKPFICFATIATEIGGVYDVNNMGIRSIYFWLTILYNASVSLSLYCLAIFWKILWNDLKPFNPVGKFLCVKLIIFASYWQGVILAILNAFHLLPGKEESSGPKSGPEASIGVCIQNALLCVELVAFAMGHWYSFSYKSYTISHIPYGRLIFKYAFKDMIGTRDLVHDFKLTFYGDYYKDYRQFDSVEATIAHPNSKGRMSKINKGLRYNNDGTQKHWIPTNSPNLEGNDVRSTSELNVPSNENLPGVSSKKSFPSVRSNSPGSPTTFIDDPSTRVILDTLKSDPILATIDYEKELFDQDELYYQEACSVVNSYNLDHHDIKALLNYPIVDELVGGHMFGYKVKKLRENRLRNMLSGSQESILRNSQSNKYGSVV